MEEGKGPEYVIRSLHPVPMFSSDGNKNIAREAPSISNVDQMSEVSGVSK